MKFGKLCAETCADLQTQAKVPTFPYKSLKQCLKRAENSPIGRQLFAEALSAELHAVDKIWKQAVHSVVRSASAPRKSAILAQVGLGRRPISEAPALVEWASLARTGLRKIKKKYNKNLRPKLGPLDEAKCSEHFAFVASPERTEIHALANAAQGLGASPLETSLWQTGGESRPVSMDANPTQMECPVCMETLFEPVAPACGHPMCKPCYDGVVKSKVTMRIKVTGGYLNIRPADAVPQCPMCREPAETTKPMVALAAMCKAADPKAFARRKHQLAASGA